MAGTSLPKNTRAPLRIITASNLPVDACFLPEQNLLLLDDSLNAAQALWMMDWAATTTPQMLLEGLSCLS